VYYLRVISVMYFGTSQREYACEGGWGAHAAMLTATILVVAVGFFPGSVMRSTRRAEQSVMRPAPVRASTAIAASADSRR
jgi:NADH:ubiquinone oxidoreductase subunit 2 (subunit N)